MRLLNTFLTVINFLLYCLLGVVAIRIWESETFYYSNLIGIVIKRDVLALFLFLALALLLLLFLKRAYLKGYFVWLQICIFILFVFFTPHVRFEFIRWYTQKIEFFKKGVGNIEELILDPCIQGDGTVVYNVNDGAIKFQDGSWIYIESNVMRGEIELKDNCDFSLAIDSQGNIYRLDDRILGDLIIHSKSVGGIPDINHFLQLRDWTVEEEGKKKEGSAPNGTKLRK